jgi:uncharacterized protein
MPGATGTVRLTLILLWAVAQLAAATAAAECPRARITPLPDLRAGLIEEGRNVTVEGVVTGVFLGPDRLGGFFVQHQARPPAGLFVHAPKLSSDAVRPGDHVQLTGRFSRFHGNPQISRINNVRVCAHIGLPAPVALRLPEDAARLAALQDVKVRFDQPLTVTGNYELGRYGSLQLSADKRLYRRTGAADTGYDSARARRIVLDDGSYRANPRPIPYLETTGTRRPGDRVEGLTGILTRAFEAHRIHPTRAPAFAEGNPRPEAPEPAGDVLRVATLNVENYFLTLGQRGAADPAQLDRQRQKLTAAVRGIDADVLSLMEVENREAAVEDLLRTLNHDLPEARQYRAVAHRKTGTDAIRNALLYRPARVTLLDAAADLDPVHNRPPLLAWFTEVDRNEPFGVVAVHFKAKVGCPDSGDVDLGQGCWNQLRTRQALRLLEWITEIRRDDAPILVAGDLNAYAGEDPVTALLAAGKHDLTHRHLPPERRYTYVFRGEAGQLDYLLARQDLAQRAAGAGIWHINADEPPFLGFAGGKPGRGPWRSSDHDPVWADLYR